MNIKIETKKLEEKLKNKPSYERAAETVEKFQRENERKEQVPIKLNTYGEYPWTIWPSMLKDSPKRNADPR